VSSERALYDDDDENDDDDVIAGDKAPLLLLLFNGDPVDVTFAQESPQVDAIMSCVYPAQATGEALYRVVTMTGPHAVPAARLPNTWPALLHQVLDAAATAADAGFLINYHTELLLVLRQTQKCVVRLWCSVTYNNVMRFPDVSTLHHVFDCCALHFGDITVYHACWLSLNLWFITGTV